MKRISSFTFAIVLFGCSQSDNKPAEQKSVQTTTSQDTTYYFAKRILNASPKEVEVILGKPDGEIKKTKDCDDLPTCKAATYHGGNVEVLYYKNKLKWLSLNNLFGFEYKNSIVERLNFPASMPSWANKSIMRWENYEGIKKILAFPKENNAGEANYILVILDQNYDKKFASSDKLTMEKANIETKKQEIIETENTAQRKKIIEDQFRSFDGSNVYLTKEIKRGMNDPASYQHISTKYFDLHDRIKVVTEFRGKNAFGALVKNTVIGQVGLDGHIIEMKTVE